MEKGKEAPKGFNEDTSPSTGCTRKTSGAEEEAEEEDDELFNGTSLSEGMRDEARL